MTTTRKEFIILFYFWSCFGPKGFDVLIHPNVCGREQGTIMIPSSHGGGLSREYGDGGRMTSQS